MTKGMQFFVFLGGVGVGGEGVTRCIMGDVQKENTVKDTKKIIKLSPVISGVAILSTVNSHCTMY